MTEEEEIDWFLAGRGARSRADGLSSTASTSSFFCFINIPTFEFRHLRTFIVNINSNSIMPRDVDPRGMLAVFMQPDSSLDEDEYAPTLTVSEIRDLHNQVP